MTAFEQLQQAMRVQLGRFTRKPEPLPHVIIRHVVATKSENVKARTAREAMTARLRAETARLTPEQREAARQRAVTRADKKGEGR
jgi:hypothetical protein